METQVAESPCQSSVVVNILTDAHKQDIVTMQDVNCTGDCKHCPYEPKCDF